MNDESNREFVDTNILVYAHDRSAGAKRLGAQALLSNLWETRRGCLSVQVLQEFFVTVTRKVAQPMPVPAASQIVADLGTWTVHSPGVDDILGAIALQERYQISFWDAMIIHSALALKCRVLWSEDLNAGQRYQETRVENPFESG